MNACRRVNHNNEAVADVAKDENIPTKILLSWLDALTKVQQIVNQELSEESMRKIAEQLATEEKSTAVMRIVNGETLVDVARDIKVNESTVRGWFDNTHIRRHLSELPSTSKSTIDLIARMSTKEPIIQINTNNEQLSTEKTDDATRTARENPEMLGPENTERKREEPVSVYFRGGYLTLKEKFTAVLRIVNGETFAAVARDINFNEYTVRKWFNEIHRTRRLSELQSTILTLEEEFTAVQRIANGETYAAVARDMNVHESNLRNWCYSKHLTMRLSKRRSTSKSTADEFVARMSTKEPTTQINTNNELQTLQANNHESLPQNDPFGVVDLTVSDEPKSSFVSEQYVIRKQAETGEYDNNNNCIPTNINENSTKIVSASETIKYAGNFSKGPHITNIKQHDLILCESNGSVTNPDIIDLTESNESKYHGPSFPSNNSGHSSMNFTQLKNVSNITAAESLSLNFSNSHFALPNDSKSRKVSRTQYVDKENYPATQSTVEAGNLNKLLSVSDLSSHMKKNGKRQRSSNTAPILHSSFHSQTNENYPRSVESKRMKYAMCSLDFPSHLSNLPVPYPTIPSDSQKSTAAVMHPMKLWPFHELNQSIIERIAGNS